ncbi:MAG: outer membrane beta-barrel protein [Verrucomicrobiota bacterium]|nr:outer membrane beta-barrel protein [Verrucomicrobiota bacterium]
MKFNQWTVGLAAVGLVSLGAVAEEAQHEVMTALSSTTISGYVNTSAILRFGHGNISPGRSFDGADKQDGFNLDVVKLQIEKPLDETDNWAAGYNIGLLFGPDANVYGTSSSKLSDIIAVHQNLLGSLTLPSGGDDGSGDVDSMVPTSSLPSTGEILSALQNELGRIDSPHLQALSHGTSDFGIKEANVVLRAPIGNGLDFKIGYWESPIGYEVFDAGNNPNYSRSFGYYIEPKQFTGILATYRVSQVIQVAGGIANQGWALLPGLNNTVVHAPMNGINSRPGLDSLKTYMGSIALTAPESAGFLKGGTLYLGIIDSSIYYGPDVVNYYVGGTIPTPLENVRVGASYDYRGNSKGEGFVASHASAVAGYATFKANDKLRFSVRGEYATGSNNTWVYFDTGESNELLGVTGTIDYNLWANALTRLEFRWDHDLTGNGMFNDGSDKNALSLALNVIYKF